MKTHIHIYVCIHTPTKYTYLKNKYKKSCAAGVTGLGHRKGPMADIQPSS